jgi:copper chaperone CopZ
MNTKIHDGQGRPGPLVPGLLMVILALLAGAPEASAQRAAGDGAQAVVIVKGVQCPFCAAGIKKHLGRIPGVSKVEVELAKNQAVVHFEPGAKATDEQIQEAVRKAGFTAGRIEWRENDEAEG